MALLSQLEQFVASALEAVEFKLIREGEKPEDAKPFHPEMAHQIFGEKENIFGYKDLKVQIYYSAGPLDVYFNTSYSKKIDDLKLDGMKGDDIDKAVSELMPGGCYYTSLDEFLSVVNKKSADFKPMGNKVFDFSIPESGSNVDGEKQREFEIYQCDMNTPNFLKYHAKFESMIFWFVDAASNIIHDPQWEFFVVFEKYKTSSGDIRYVSVGYTTVYLYFSYPENIRPRISQMFVLPPFQRMGIGSKIIEAIYSYYGSKPNVTDITVEEPSDIFQEMRSAVDAKFCKNLESFSPEKLKAGLSKEMLNEAKEKFKINPKQCRIVYEILKLGVINCKDPKEYRDYRLEVKKRLTMYFAKQKRDLLRAEKRGVNIANALATLPTDEQRLEQLQIDYKKIEDTYKKILKKINQEVSNTI
uniref:Histone acetyltransferase type B catalytic subunit n=1 Tax=Culicoides sonorensis TaxID=179676 RepID=A0A336KDZ6_CULSO